MKFIGLKKGQDLKDRAVHQNFQDYPGGMQG